MRIPFRSVTALGRFVGVGLLLLSVCLSTVGASKSAQKRVKPAQKPPEAVKPSVARKADESVSAICIEAQTGLVLAEQNADALRPPASMVKMMLMLLVGEGLRDGKWTLETPIAISEKAQAMGGSQIYLEANQSVPLGRIMLAVAVASANDAAMAVAEALWGSEEAYLKRMNERAAELGMTRSVFRSVHGLPPGKGKEPDETTARDMARLAQFCVRDPQILEWTSTKEAVLKDGAPAAYNTNKLLWKMDGCDGVKTGYIRDAGYCVTATAVRDGIRLIAVAMGLEANHARFEAAQSLLEQAFTEVTKARVVARGDAVGQPVVLANARQPSVQLTAGDDLWVVVKKSDLPRVEVAVRGTTLIQPPVTAGAALARACAELGGVVLGSVPACAPDDIAAAGTRWKLEQSLRRR